MSRYLFLFILIFAGCTRDLTTPLQRWEAANIQSINIPERFMAQDTSGSCRDDLSNKSDIQFMIDREEKRLAFELSGRAMEVGRSQFLLQHFINTRSQFVEGSRSQTNCESVPCLYEPFYGRESLEGLLSYLFWLRTGYALAVVNEIPHWTNPSVKGPYKYSLDEIKKFVDLALNTDEFKSVRTLKGFFRFANNYGPGGNACGIAYSSGYVMFSDGCLLDHAIFHSIVHEIGHHLDFSTSSRGNEYGISEGAEWMALSGWHLKEIKDEATGLTVKREWAKSGKGNFWRDYSAKDPIEDWADHYSLYYVQPKEMRELSADKYKFISVKGYRGVEFDNASEAALQSGIAFESSKNPFLSDLGQCVPESGGTESAVTDCFAKVLASNVDKTILKMLQSTTRSCRVAKANKALVSENLEKRFKSTIGEYISNISLFIESTKASIAYSEALKKIDLSLPYISCFSQMDAETCFLTKVRALAEDRILPSWSKYSIRIGETKEEFLNGASFDAVSKETRLRYSRMFSLSDRLIKSLAKASWDLCSKVSPSSGPEVVDSQNTAQLSEYINPAIKGCLRTSYDTKFMTSLNASLQQNFRVNDRQTQDYVRFVFMDDYFGAVGEILSVERREETKKLQQWVASSIKPLSIALLADTSWIKEAFPISISCRGAAKKKMIEGFPKGIFVFVANLKFAPRDEVLIDIADRSCELVAADPKVNVLFSGSTAEQFQASYEFLRERVRVQTKIFTEDCKLGAISSTLAGWGGVNEKTACGIANSASILKAAFEDWKASPYGQKSGSNTSRIWSLISQDLVGLIKAVTSDP